MRPLKICISDEKFRLLESTTANMECADVRHEGYASNLERVLTQKF
jgi:hypothetical protein